MKSFDLANASVGLNFIAVTVGANMSRWRYLWRSVRHHWRMLATVAAGVAVATAVLTGALVVGDSVQASLRRVTLDRLGNIHSALLAEHFFSSDLARRLAADPAFADGFTAAEPVVWFQRVTIQSRDGGAQSAGVQLMGVQPSFWATHSEGSGPSTPLGPRQIVVNQPLADDLGLAVGDQVMVRLPATSSVAGDSVLADKTDLTTTMADMEVVAVIPAQGVGRFSPQPSQQYPLAAFVDLGAVQNALGKPDAINAVLVASSAQDNEPRNPPDELVHATLDDLGLRLEDVRQMYQPAGEPEPLEAYRYFQLTTERMVFPPEAEPLLASVMTYLGAEPSITYLVNSIERLGDPVEGRRSSIPYSTATGIVEESVLSPLADEPRADAGTASTLLGETGVALNSWAAEELGARVGDAIRLTYFQPESSDGNAEETHFDLTLTKILPLVEPREPYRQNKEAVYDQRPGLANDPRFTPTVEGITDQESIDDWDPPFPFDNSRMRESDDLYWEDYRGTPKAFLSLDTARRLWSSRFGVVTSYRIPATEGRTLDSVRDDLQRVLDGQHAAFGFQWLTLRRDGLLAASGTTPFNGLFLAFSMFLIIAALLLVILLFRLMIEQRAAELGLLLAVGISPRRAAGFWLREGLGVSVLGALIGVPLGVGYAWLMLWGLRTIWVGAISTPFLELDVRPATLAVGSLVGAAVAVVTIAWTCWGAGRQPARELLAGRMGSESSVPARRGRWGIGKWVALALLVTAAGSGAAALRLSGEAQAGAFFAGGISMLAALLLLVRVALRRDSHRDRRPVIATLWGLAQQNLARNPGRSLLTIGLLASASFLIVAVSAFRLPLTDRGTGRFALVAESDRPVFENLDTPEGREEWFGMEAQQLSDMRVVSFRVRDGDDASCRNLFRAQRPRLLGLPESAARMLAESVPPRFGWSAQLASGAERRSAWLQLDNAADGDVEIIPVVIDKNTAVYSLHLTGGVGQQFELDYGTGGVLRFQVVGLLDNSLLQGVLIVSERNLLKHFPGIAGYRYFLIDPPVDRVDEVRTTLERTLGDRGMDVRLSSDVLRGLYAIQNTYLSTFQSLGGLGLLLGTLGLAVVQVRNVLERRRELGLLQALGFGRERLMRLVLAEHFLLLAWGIVLGCLAALWVVVPHGITGGATVPWISLAVMLAAVVGLGAASGAWAVSRGVRADLMQSLREG